MGIWTNEQTQGTDATELRQISLNGQPHVVSASDPPVSVMRHPWHMHGMYNDVAGTVGFVALAESLHTGFRYARTLLWKQNRIAQIRYYCSGSIVCSTQRRTNYETVRPSSRMRLDLGPCREVTPARHLTDVAHLSVV
jgi:hypothetical protein